MCKYSKYKICNGFAVYKWKKYKIIFETKNKFFIKSYLQCNQGTLIDIL